MKHTPPMPKSRLIVVDQPKPLRIEVTPERAAVLFPDSPYLQERWMAACRWMQSRPGGSIWIMDEEAPPPKWRGLPVKEQFE